jgi:glyoxylase-like metal-dependent hydrolase (beta-lactamase superfamily II)
MQVKKFTFNDFQENTYIISDSTKECIIIDPGCNSVKERKELDKFIDKESLTPVMLVNTHCHIDHVLGNSYVAKKYSLTLFAHDNEKKILDFQPQVAAMYGISYDPSPLIGAPLEAGGTLSFGETTLQLLFVPGHAPGHICLYDVSTGHCIAGDALFKGSIGRTDLPGGDHDTLIASIKSELFTLPDDTIVWPGHGESTTIGIEKITNPFF